MSKALTYETTPIIKPSKFLKRKAMIKDCNDMRKLSTASILYKLYRQRHFATVNGLVVAVLGFVIGLSI